MSHINRRGVLAAITAAPALLVVAACGSNDSSSGAGGSATTGAGNSSPGNQSDPGGSTTAAGAYRAGDYDATGSYQTPGGKQSVEVKMTLTADGTVSGVEVVPQAKSGNSVQFQKKFASGISGEVTGKKIDDLNVSKVSGSSLTSGGFNAALETIKGEAKA